MTTTDTAARTPRKRPPRSLRDVETAAPAALAMMTRAQVNVLCPEARSRRVERILADRETKWVLRDVARHFGVSEATARTWRWRTDNEKFVGRNVTILPRPLPDMRRGGRGKPQPQWLMSEIVAWGPEIERADRNDYVTFPRKRPGRTPDALRVVAPAQRSAADDMMVAEMADVA